MSPKAMVRAGSSGRAVRAFSLVFLLTALAASPSPAQLARLDTGQLAIIYFDFTESYLVPHAVQSFLRSLEFQRQVFGFDPNEQVYVLLADFSDGADAGASVTPRNRLSIQIAPLGYAFETIAANDRIILIMNHELVHVATMGQPAGADKAFRSLFGGKVSTIKEQPETAIYAYLTAPRVAAPRWFHEGIAVFADTWMDGGIGRAQGGWDEMVFRAMVKDNAHIYDPLGLASEGTKIDFQLQINAYLYGTRFMTWLANRYSPEQLVEWTSRKPGSKAYYSSQFKKVFNRSIEDAWAEWIAFEKGFQQKNLEAIRKYPITPYKDLSKRALGSVSRAYYDEKAGKIYAAFNYPGVVAHVGAFDLARASGAHITDVKDPAMYTVTALAWDPDSRMLFYTRDNGAYRDLMSLDPATGRKKMLQKDARIGDLAFSRADKALWGIRHLNGLATLVRIVPPYTDWKQIHTFAYGEVPYDLDVSPDGTLLACSFGLVNGHQSVRVMDVAKVLKKDVTPVAEFDFGEAAVPNNFVFSPDGRFLYGSSYLTGVSNIYRYELATKKIEAVTNAETGFFRPLPLGGDDLFAFRFSGQGFVLTRLTATPIDDLGNITFLGTEVVEKHPVLKTWNTETRPPVDYNTLDKKKGKYGLTGGLKGESFYPIVQGYKDTQAVGMRFNFSDPLELNRFTLAGSYSLNGDIATNERLHVRMDYERYDWKFKAMYNNADFYDIVGPTKTGRKGYVFGVEHKRSLVYDEPKKVDVTFGASYSGNLDRLPAYQNVEVSVDRLASFDARLNVLEHDRLDGPRGRREGPQGERRSGGRLRGRHGGFRDARHVGRRVPAADRPFVRLVPQRGRILAERRQQPVRELLLRRLRQQLRGLPQREAVPRVLQLPRTGAERAGRPQFRPHDDRMDPAAVAVREGGDAGGVLDLGASRAVRERHRHEHGRLGHPPRRRNRGRPAGLPLHRALEPGHDAVGGRRRGVRAGARASPRGDGVAEGPQVEFGPWRSASSRPCSRCSSSWLSCS